MGVEELEEKARFAGLNLAQVEGIVEQLQ